MMTSSAVDSSLAEARSRREAPAAGQGGAPWRAKLDLLIQQVDAAHQMGLDPSDRESCALALLQMLSQPVLSTDLAYACRQLITLGVALLLHHQRPTEAEPIFVKCCEMLEGAGAELTLLRIMAMRRLAVVYLRELRACEAMDLTLRAQALLDQTIDPGEEPWYLQCMLAICLHLVGFLAQAEARFLAVVAHAQARPPKPKDSPMDTLDFIASACQGNLAQLNLQRGDFETSVRLGRDALADLDARGRHAPMYHEWRWQRSAVLCESLVRLGRAREADVHVDAILASEALGPSLPYSIHREMACGLVAVANGRQRVGLNQLEQVLAESRSRRYLVHSALALLISAYELVGDHEQALKCIQELTQLMTKVSQDLALAMESGQAVREDTLTFMLSSRAAESRVNALLQMAKSHPMPSLRRLAQATSLVDDETGNHCGRVGRLVFLLARELGHSQESAQLFADAAQLHDIGKSGINHQILLKPGPLSAAEQAVVRRHVDIGAAILGRVDHPVAAMASLAVLSHQERWDGTGYPRGLAGRAIPEVARITAVADVYDVMRSRRCYKAGWGREQAFAELRRCAGTQFDPDMVAAFLRLPDAALEEIEGDYDLA